MLIIYAGLASASFRAWAGLAKGTLIQPWKMWKSHRGPCYTPADSWSMSLWWKFSKRPSVLDFLKNTPQKKVVQV